MVVPLGGAVVPLLERPGGVFGGLAVVPLRGAVVPLGGAVLPLYRAVVPLVSGRFSDLGTGRTWGRTKIENYGPK